MGLDIGRIREETPSTGEIIHFNNAGSSLMPEPVYRAYMDYQQEEWKEGGYETMAARHADLDAFYHEGARMLNAGKDELAFTDSATTAWQRAFFGIPWEDGDEIITANSEYASNYISFLRLAKIKQVKVRVAHDNGSGELDLEHLRSLVNTRTRLIAITHMPTIGGVVEPVEEVGTIARENGILYLVDACQSVGHYPLDVEKIGCDILSGTGRKYLRGPRGTGLLYVRKEVIPRLDPVSVDLFSARWESGEEYVMRKNGLRFETFESNLAAKAGLARAIRYQNDLGMEGTWSRIREIAGKLRQVLKGLPGVHVPDSGQVLSGIVTFTVKGMSCREVQEKLAGQRINVSFGSTFNSRLLMEAKGLEEVVRSSVHYFNTEEEIAEFEEAMSRIVKGN